MRNYTKIHDRKSMSCNAVLITQFNFPELEASTQIYSDDISCGHIFNRNLQVRMKNFVSGCKITSLGFSCIMRVNVPVYSLDLNRLLRKPPLTADVGGRYFSSSAVFSHDMSPRTWLRSVIPHNLMAVSSSSLNTALLLAYNHRLETNPTYYPHNVPHPPCRT